jgi:DNA-binding NarL/FixJ family response regulator
MPATISIVEDNIISQQVLSKIIRDSEDFVLLKIYNSAEAAMDMVKEPPELAIVDIELPGINGIEFTKHLKMKAPGIQCLIFSMHDDDDVIVQALESGASGYILKKSTPDEVISAIKEVRTGGAPMSPYVAKRVISFFRKPILNEQELLSKRENEVIQLLGAGLSYKEIAEKLFVSYETVKQHLKNIYIKLNVQNKVEALNKLNQMFFHKRRNTA